MFSSIVFSYIVGEVYITHDGKEVVVVSVDAFGDATVETADSAQLYNVNSLGNVTDPRIPNFRWGIAKRKIIVHNPMSTAVPYRMPPNQTKFACRSAALGFLDWARMDNVVAVELDVDSVKAAFLGTIPDARSLGTMLLNEVNYFSPLTFKNMTLLNPGGPKLLFQADVPMWTSNISFGGAIQFTPPPAWGWNILDDDGSRPDVVKHSLQCTCDFHALLREGCKCGAMAAERKKA